MIVVIVSLKTRPGITSVLHVRLEKMLKKLARFVRNVASKISFAVVAEKKLAKQIIVDMKLSCRLGLEEPNFHQLMRLSSIQITIVFSYSGIVQFCRNQHQVRCREVSEHISLE